MYKRSFFLCMLVVVLMAFVVTGCVPSATQFDKKLDPNSWWDKYLVIPLSDLLDWVKTILGGYGLSILVVTFLVRLGLFPLFLKQQKSTKAMQEIQPHLNKIREKYKDDRQKVQQKTMELFKEHEINPMAGCLPTLIQLPVMIAFYQAIMYNSHIKQSSFLYMQLGSSDPYYILPLLAAFTTYLQLIVTGADTNPQMKIMVWAMPVMIFMLALNLPAALSLYWVYSNVFTILQYVFFVKNKKEKKQEGVAS